MGIILDYVMYVIYVCVYVIVIQRCFICRPSDSTVSEEAGIEPRSVTTLTLWH